VQLVHLEQLLNLADNNEASIDHAVRLTESTLRGDDRALDTTVHVDLRAGAVEDVSDALRQSGELATAETGRVAVVVHNDDVEPAAVLIDVLQLLVGSAVPVAVLDVHNDVVAVVVVVATDEQAAVDVLVVSRRASVVGDASNPVVVVGVHLLEGALQAASGGAVGALTLSNSRVDASVVAQGDASEQVLLAAMEVVVVVPFAVREHRSALPAELRTASNQSPATSAVNTAVLVVLDLAADGEAAVDVNVVANSNASLNVTALSRGDEVLNEMTLKSLYW